MGYVSSFFAASGGSFFLLPLFFHPAAAGFFLLPHYFFFLLLRLRRRFLAVSSFFLSRTPPPTLAFCRKVRSSATRLGIAGRGGPTVVHASCDVDLKTIFGTVPPPRRCNCEREHLVPRRVLQAMSECVVVLLGVVDVTMQIIGGRREMMTEDNGQRIEVGGVDIGVAIASRLKGVD